MYAVQTISVIGSIQFIKLMFVPKRGIFLLKLRTWFKVRTKMVYQEHARYELLIQSSNIVTNSFYFHHSIEFCAPLYFSVIFSYFAKKMKLLRLPFIFNIFILHEYISFYVHLQGAQKPI